MSDLLEKLKLTRAQMIGLAVVLTVWLASVITSGAGWNPFPWKWDFTNTGAFGDSFAPLSAFMALIAAIGAIGAYRVQADEIKRIRAREEELDAITMSDRARLVSRQAEADRQQTVQSFESTFFHLLSSLRTVIGGLDLVAKKDGKRTEGHDVFRVMLHNFKDNLEGKRDVKSVAKMWADMSDHYRNDLNHYFRLLYHIVRFIHNSSVEDKYFYVQIVRASLSDAELALLALNCDYGDGREKFKELVEKYALLHNLSDKEIKWWKLRQKYEATAFEYAPPESTAE